MVPGLPDPHCTYWLEKCWVCLVSTYLVLCFGPVYCSHTAVVGNLMNKIKAQNSLSLSFVELFCLVFGGFFCEERGIKSCPFFGLFCF